MPLVDLAARKIKNMTNDAADRRANGMKDAQRILGGDGHQATSRCGTRGIAGAIRRLAWLTNADRRIRPVLRCQILALQSSQINATATLMRCNRGTPQYL
jgi:hypothetical protein